MYKLLFFLLSSTLICSTCSQSTGDLTSKNNRDFPKYEVLFNKKAAKPLKETWPTFYRYIKEGHLRQIKKRNPDVGINYIYSNALYNYYENNKGRIWRDPFFKQYDNIIKIFGEPDKNYIYQEKMIVCSYAIYVLDQDSNPHTLLTFIFDKETKLLYIAGES